MEEEAPYVGREGGSINSTLRPAYRTGTTHRQYVLYSRSVLGTVPLLIRSRVRQGKHGR